MNTMFFMKRISKNKKKFPKVKFFSNKSLTFEYNYIIIHNVQKIMHRGMEQLAARRAHNPKVVSSSLTPATNHQTLETVKFQGFLLLFYKILYIIY